MSISIFMSSSAHMDLRLRSFTHVAQAVIVVSTLNIISFGLVFMSFIRLMSKCEVVLTFSHQTQIVRMISFLSNSMLMYVIV